MRFVLALVLFVHTAHAEIGFLQEGAMGTASASGLVANDGGGLAVRASIGGRYGHFGGEFTALKADLGDDPAGQFSAFTLGPVFTVRHQFLHEQLDGFFARWFEIYGRIGPTYTWVLGDPGAGPMDGASGPSWVVGGGLRFVYACVSLSAEVTVVNAHVRAAAEHDPADELGVHDVPGIDANGTIVMKTFGLGFAF
jgi:hypothetical protein